MATLSDKIYGLLKNDATVAAIVGTRIYPEFVQEGALPYMTYFQVSHQVKQSFITTARSATQGPIRIQIDCYSKTYSEIRALETAIKDALTFQDTEASIRMDGSFEASDFPGDGEEGIIRRITMDAIVFAALALV